MAKNAAKEDVLGSLHTLLATVMTEALKNPDTRTAAVMNAARGFLKDNDITCTVDDKNALGELRDQLGKQGEQAAEPVADPELDEALADVLNMAQYRGRL